MLLIDIGNSRVKAAFSDELALGWAVSYQAGDRQAAINQLLQASVRKPHKVVLCCVSDQRSADWVAQLVVNRWGLDTTRLVASETFDGLVNGYTECKQLGIDRWCGLVAAWHRLQAPLVVVGCGTAITVDSVNKGGQHLGGVIFPGLGLAENSFYGHTGNIRSEASSERVVYAHDTAAAVYSGVRWAVSGGINDLLRRLATELGGVANVWLTGGDAAELTQYIDADTQQVDSLVFQGMVLLGEH